MIKYERNYEKNFDQIPTHKQITPMKKKTSSLQTILQKDQSTPNKIGYTPTNRIKLNSKIAGPPPLVQ